MLGRSPFYALAPHVKRTALHVLAHDGPDLILLQPILHLNRLERRAVFPCHFDDAIDDLGFEVGSVVFEVVWFNGQHGGLTREPGRRFLNY